MTFEVVSEEFDCFFVDDIYNHKKNVCGVEVVGKIADLSKLSKQYKFAIVAIGDNLLRERITKQCLSFGFILVSAVSKLSYISKWAIIGDGCIILPLSSVHNGAKIGMGTVLCSHTEIHHDSQVGNFCVIYPCSVVRTYAIVGNRVRCGSNVSIGNNCVIESNSDIPNGSVLEKQISWTKTIYLEEKQWNTFF